MGITWVEAEVAGGSSKQNASECGPMHTLG